MQALNTIQRNNIMFSEEKIIELARESVILGQTVTSTGLARFCELIAKELEKVKNG